ncbi:hypothetical protein P9152_17665 [Bacillus subtilis]|uniref:hypothetical protein n=1 Tax=Bacillus subtilis TaxID=1423 RepID=UPI00137486CF|nr:hypothetical protein [Bacillus subtilis]MEC3621127.1 hypothetical protein [Bacillus subtilis]MEC3636619.1 hypothetical protein [Bacillus subtilis]MEC3641513.1 hypothetical protein [Bacillus subtilis]MEC3648276.1 hypothetical protein [Bacillus subtilis]MEC3698667.1 hypothetical protein [Bacillus subtilis]
MKKSKFILATILSIILLVLLSWFFYTATHQPPILKGHSKDGKWSVIYSPEKDIDLARQDLWAVHITWKRDSEFSVKEVVFKENGVVEASGDATDEPKNAKKIAVAIMGDPPNTNNDYTVEVTWEENGKTQKDIIKVNKEIKRSFVIPNAIKRILSLG